MSDRGRERVAIIVSELRAIGGLELSIGEKLQIAREHFSLSRQALSEKSGVTRESICKIETGRQDPRYGTVGRLLAAMGLSSIAELGPL